MLKGIISTLIIISCKLSVAQSGEFEIQNNGLIYGESTINSLKKIVDSLNLKFKVCDIDRIFDSKYQTIGHLIQIEKTQVKEAKKDIENNIGFDEFIQKYPQTKVDENNLIVRFSYKNYQEKDVVEFSKISLSGGYGREISFEKNLEQYTPQNLSNWVFDYSEKTSYSEESITAFYFPGKFQSAAIPEEYSQMISYADCLIDTTATKFKNNIESGWVDVPENWKSLSEKEKEKLLDELRSTRVIGFCSMDSRPRKHAVNIAMLSAETQNWEIFLRAHLDVMNDRFERVSDGSYAWGARKTYIKELEELNIDVLDLIIGISLRAENSSHNHYYGSISRIGRALSETNNKAQVEKQLFEILRNKDLDLYNRILILYIIENYIYNLTNEDEKQKLKTELKESIKTFPKRLSEKIKTE
tara:strand:- start:4951 stop:6192 length:1242 start_codon:yes stop_codon:yes gene_type:complete